jgi:hypothetical protein
VTAPEVPGGASAPSRPEDDEAGRDGFDAALLEVVYDIAVASLDQVISLSEGDFLT